MGCWQETCAVTRLNIAWGDEVLLIVLNPAAMYSELNMYAFMNACWNYCKYDDFYDFYVENINGYKELLDALPPERTQGEEAEKLRQRLAKSKAELAERSSQKGEKPYTLAVFGKYDDYGGVENIEGVPEGWSMGRDPYLMVHRSAFEAIVAYMRPNHDARHAADLASQVDWKQRDASAWKPLTDFDYQLYLFASFCWDAHVALVPHQDIRGRQYFDRESLDVAAKLAEITAERWRSQDARDRREREED